MTEHFTRNKKAEPALSSWARKNPLAGYFLLAYGISWAIGIPLAVMSHSDRPLIPFSVHYLVGYGPLLAAIIMTWLTGGLDGLKELLARIIKWRVRPILVVAAVSPLILFAIMAVGQRLAQGMWPNFALLGQVNFLPGLGFKALPLWIFTFGFGEETGWRGYALPRLQKNHSALSATLILAMFWAIWHWPQFFYLFDVSIFWGWLVGLLAGAIVFTWLYNSARGSILLVAVWHGAFNFITASKAGQGTVAAGLSIFVIIWAVVVVVLFKPAHLSDKERQVI